MARLMSPITKQGWFWIVALLPCLISILYLANGWSTEFIPNSLFICLLLVLSVIDCEQLILPDILTLPGTLVAMPCAILVNDLPWELSLAGAIVGWAWFYLLAKLNPDMLGLGDSKLMLLVCGYLGLKAIFPLILITILLLVLYFIYNLFSTLFILEDINFSKVLKPFAPFLCFSAYVYILLQGVMI